MSQKHYIEMLRKAAAENSELKLYLKTASKNLRLAVKAWDLKEQKRKQKERNKYFAKKCLTLTIFGIVFVQVVWYLEPFLLANDVTDIAILHEEFDPNLVPDYALYSAGAKIYGTPKALPYYPTGAITLFTMSFSFSPASSFNPHYILQPWRSPGECWPFAGQSASVQIILSHLITPWAVTLEHIPQSLSPTGYISSAPRHFSVHSFDPRHPEEEDVLGFFEYKRGDQPIQTFFINGDDKNVYPTRYLEFQFHTNHGNPTYTCIYKIRVHGDII